MFDLSLPQRINSPDHYSIGTPSVSDSPKRFAFLRPLVGVRFHVLFHSPPGVLFTFPSRYWFTIGHGVVFSLTRWSWQIHTGFHVSRATWESKQEKISIFGSRGCHPLWPDFPDSLARQIFCNFSGGQQPAKSHFPLHRMHNACRL